MRMSIAREYWRVVKRVHLHVDSHRHVHVHVTIVNGVSKPVRNFNPHSGHRIQFQMAQASTRSRRSSETRESDHRRRIDAKQQTLIATQLTGKAAGPNAEGLRTTGRVFVSFQKLFVFHIIFP